jgi:shikimate dehydrogenase
MPDDPRLKPKNYSEKIKILRASIDDIDEKILNLFTQRLNITAEISSLKQKFNEPVFDKLREEEILSKASENSPAQYKVFAAELFEKILEISRNYQENLGA